MKIDLSKYKPIYGVQKEEKPPSDEYKRITEEANERIRQGQLAYGEAYIRSATFIAR